MNFRTKIAEDGLCYLYPEGYDPANPKEKKIKTEEEARAAFEDFVAKKSRFYPDWIPTNWVPCVFLGHKAPPDRVIEVYSANVKKWMLSDFNKSENVFQDYQGRLHCKNSDKMTEVYNIDGEVLIYSHYEVDSSMNSRVFSNTVARGVNYYTNFESGFRDHTAGNNKAFVKPPGEAIGIEIEVKFKAQKSKSGKEIPDCITKLMFSRWMLENYPEWICERDGSLEGEKRQQHGGLEIISPPLSVKQVKDDLAIILPKCVEMGGIGFKASTPQISYGIHITQNLYGSYTRKEGDRYTWLINSPDLRFFWSALARRSGDLFDRFSGFKEIPSVDGAMRHQADGHYRSVFPRGESAVETRIFRSNLDINAISCMIDICVLAMNFCKQSKVDVTKSSEFVTWVKTKSSPLLKKYLESLRAWDYLDESFAD